VRSGSRPRVEDSVDRKVEREIYRNKCARRLDHLKLEQLMAGFLCRELTESIQCLGDDTGNSISLR